MVILEACKSSQMYSSSYINVESSTSIESSLTIISVILIVIGHSLVLVDDYSLIDCVVVWIFFHMHAISCIMGVLFTDGTPFSLFIFQIVLEIVCFMWCDFPTYFTIILCSYYSNILDSIVSMPTSIFCVPFCHTEGAP